MAEVTIISAVTGLGPFVSQRILKRAAADTMRPLIGHRPGTGADSGRIYSSRTQAGALASMVFMKSRIM